jgi:hypothetical protein
MCLICLLSLIWYTHVCLFSNGNMSISYMFYFINKGLNVNQDNAGMKMIGKKNPL